MKTTLLTLALVAAAGAAGAQTATMPATGGAGAAINNSTAPNGNTGAQAQMNGSMNANGITGTSANTNMANAPAQRMTGAAGTAQKRIEQDGYKNVQNLQQGSDGLWHGTAMRGGSQVQVTVDRAGRVSAQ